MKKIITTALFVGSLMSTFGATSLLAKSDTQTIEQKAQKLVADAKVKAQALIEKAKADAAALKAEAHKSMNDTSKEAKTLAAQTLQKVEQKKEELADKTTATLQHVKEGTKDKLVYTKELVNKSVVKTKSAVNDALILSSIKYAYLTSPDIHSTKIDVDVKDGVVRLFGKVSSEEEAQEAMLIAFLTKGVWAVESFFVIEK